MRPQSAKAKGRRFQQEIAASILDAFPQLGKDDVRSTSMGCGGEDVQLSPAARECVPFSIEAKNQERLNVWSALDQAASNCGGNAPLLVMRRNRSPSFAVLRWEELLRLLVLVGRRVRGEEREGAGDGPSAGVGDGEGMMKRETKRKRDKQRASLLRAAIEEAAREMERLAGRKGEGEEAEGESEEEEEEEDEGEEEGEEEEGEEVGSRFCRPSSGPELP